MGFGFFLFYHQDSDILMYFVYKDQWCNIYWTTASQNWGNSLYLPSFNIGRLSRSILIKSKVIDWVKKEVFFMRGYISKHVLPVTSLDFKCIFVRMLQFCWFVEEKGILNSCHIRSRKFKVEILPSVWKLWWTHRKIFMCVLYLFTFV